MSSSPLTIDEDSGDSLIISDDAADSLLLVSPDPPACTLDTIAVGEAGTAQAEIADDWKFIDGIETVTLTERAVPGSPTNCIRALAGNLTRREVAGLSATSLGLEPDDLAFTLWISTLNNRTPRRGDKLTRDDGAGYTILSAQLSALDTCWRCLCRKQA